MKEATKTLYVHIGTQKTATTSIQAFCECNRTLLEQKNYCYPDFPFNYRGKAHRRNGAFLGGIYYDAEKVRHPEIEAQNFREGMALVQDLFQRYDNVILSDEGLWADINTKRRRTLWKELREYAREGKYQIRVIVYLRRQDQFVESQWNQRIKHAVALVTTIGWEEYLATYQAYVFPDYCSTLKRIEKELGRESLLVRRFRSECLLDGDILADFLHQIGLELTEEYVLPEENLNQRFSCNMIEIKRILNGMESVTEQDCALFEQLMQGCTEDSEADYPSQMFSTEEAVAFTAQFEAGNREVAERYLRDGQPLFDNRYSEKEKWRKDNPYLINDLIRFSGRTTVYLSEQLQKQQWEIQKLKKDLQSVQKRQSVQERRYRKLLKMLKHPVSTLFQKMVGKKGA